MKIINTPQQIPVLVDDDDFEFLSKFKWNVFDRYADSNIDGKTTKMHRLILKLNDNKFHVDHINGVTVDNRKENLRICSRFQNQQNRKVNKNSTFGEKGISILPSGNFRVRVQAFGVRYHVGVFNTIEEAINAREKYAKDKHLEFYRRS
jgi:hypothetical protein